jgi:hypothetical protein
MRAIVFSGFAGLESLVIKELPKPKPIAGHVLIAIKAFGVNQAIHFGLFEALSSVLLIFPRLRFPFMRLWIESRKVSTRQNQQRYFRSMRCAMRSG